MMKLLKEYPNKRYIVVAALGYLLGGFATFWTIYTTENTPQHDYMTAKIVGACLYGLLFVLHLLFTINRIRYGVEGIVRVHHKDNDYSDITKQFRKAKNTIEIISYHGNNLLYYTKNAIIDALKRDVDVRLLIARKRSPLLKEAQDMESSYKKNDQGRAWETIEEIKKEAKGKTCSIRFFKFNTQARYALIIVDGRWAWWTPYHPGLNVPDTSSFVLSDTGKKAIINECKKHFRTLWLKLEKNQAIKYQRLRDKQKRLQHKK